VFVLSGNQTLKVRINMWVKKYLVLGYETHKV
jgi:hypothetical protein